MKMTAQRRALDKIYKRRDRYEIPEWQRGEVWDDTNKQQLIDSILRGWRLPKFYFVKNGDLFEVVDGQQRLTAIYEFFANELPLADEAVAKFGGPYYKDLKSNYSDAFDDFEIDYDEITDANEQDLKLFFQRLQEGWPLTSSEKLNSVHSKLRDYCVALAKHPFFKQSVTVANSRLAHFDIMSKVAIIEIEGIGTGLRYDDIRPVFDSQVNFSATSAVGKRIKAALDLLVTAFPTPDPVLKNRSVVQSMVTLTCRLVDTGNSKGLQKKVAAFARAFMAELRNQIELGQGATDFDYIRFQKSINANVKAAARTRQEILLRKAFLHDPELANAFDPSALVESGLNGRIGELGEQIAALINKLNSAYSALHGKDLFKATNKTVAAYGVLRKPVQDYATYKSLVESLYFIFRESIGQRLDGVLPASFVDVNTLRTDLQHDVDHGDKAKVKTKKKKIGETFIKYSGEASPEVLDAGRFVLVQANLLSALELDLANLPVPKDAP
jgi:hypothetical protein